MEYSEATVAQKAIHYALVARGSTVLAEFSAVPTPAKAIARQILDRMPATTCESDSYASYAHDRYIYHVKRSRDAGLTVLCMADNRAGRMVPYAFLHEIHANFLKNYGNRDIHTALAYSMNDEFSRVLSQQMDYYSKNPNANRINRILAELSEVRHVMVESIDKILERGEKLEVLIHKTGCIQEKSLKFVKQSSRCKKSFWRSNVKLAAGVAGVVLTSLTMGGLIVFGVNPIPL